MSAPPTTLANEPTVSARALGGIVYTTTISSVYFALGVVAHRALGLTPLVFLAAGLFFALSAATYVEGAAMHQERGGSSMFARYAFNELVSFVAGWAILLDYAILIAVTAFAATHYLATFWSPLGHGVFEVLISIAIVAIVAVVNVLGTSVKRLQRRIVIAIADFAVQLVVIGIGIVLVLHPKQIVDSIQLGSQPTWGHVVYALTIATIAFTGLEAATGLAGEVRTTPRSLKLLLGPGVGVIVLVYVGIALVGTSALPVAHGTTALGNRYLDVPVLGIVSTFHPHALAQTLRYVVAGMAVVALVSATNGAMLGIARVGYSLATNRQIPSALGRLHPQRNTPFVLIGIAAVLSSALLLPADLDFLVGIYAFGALLAFTIAHASIVALRYREPKRPRPYVVPFSIRFRGGQLPLPAVLGGLIAAAGWGSVLVLHSGARAVGVAWMLAGLLLYVVYRKLEGKPLLKRVTIPERALRYEPPEPQLGSILVPVFGTPLDDDIIQTAGRLAGDVQDDFDDQGAVIEALWVFEVPIALPLDARLPEAQTARAKAALKRAKAVGEEYEGVEVATAMVRARRAGEGIVREARRRGVQAIVLAAEEPSRVRGGALFGGAGGARENFVGEVTKYVIRKAGCRVILTAPAADRRPSGAGGPGPNHYTPRADPELPLPPAAESGPAIES
jgi:basic amino acid/polyamine antiporter, APA family